MADIPKSVYDQYIKNSADWNNADDNGKAALAKTNADIRQQYGINYDSNSGTTDWSGHNIVQTPINSAGINFTNNTNNTGGYGSQAPKTNITTPTNKAEYEANSKAWATADPTTKAALEAANAAYRTNNGLIYDSTTGTTTGWENINKGAAAPNGYIPLRNYVNSNGGSVGYIGDKVYVNGQEVVTNGQDGVYYNESDDRWYVDPNSDYAKQFDTSFKNEYAQQQKEALDKILNYSYDPNNDAALARAQEMIRNQAINNNANRGQGYMFGLATNQQIAENAAAGLIPQYQELDFNKKKDNYNTLNTAYNQGFNEWQASRNDQQINIDNEYKARTSYLQEQEQKLNREQMNLNKAWQRVEELGYVDEWASVILGIPSGTASASVRQAKEQLQNQITLSKLELENNKEYLTYQVSLANQQ